ncbi:MAG: DUF4145 domain-containing protein [Candidatus Peregrinibacteria bacterium]|nr:DUF4145 domain-containing protein [Candidatus Peregrinibacteria bacterium]
MKPTLHNSNVRARCPDCDGAVTTFEVSDGHKEFGHIRCERPHRHEGQTYPHAIYRLVRCAGCGRGGIASICGGNHDKLIEFFPRSINTLKLPNGLPDGIEAEFREAELSASVGAYRAASALFRSVLEKVLKANGYTEGKLQQKIDAAAKDGVLTETRKKRAHEEIRVLGNEVVHDDWREVSSDEVDLAHGYAQRIIEDFYDDRATIEAILIAKKRIETASK